jgi:putative ABC transport system permease protein
LNEVSERYFETLGTPIVAGRDFTRRDIYGSAKVAIVSQSMAQRYFSGANPLGQRFVRLRDGERTGETVEIVGVVKDAKYGSLKEEASPFVFFPWSQSGIPGPLTSFELRPVGGSPAELIAGVKAAIGRVNRDVSIEFETLAARAEGSIKRERLLAALSGFFGGLALLVAAIGLYGVMSQNVARRRNEIGIRMALGAAPSRVLGMVMREAALLTAIGLAVGLAASAGTARLVASFLYGTRANDPWTLFVSAGVLAAVASLAGLVPARRAARVDPMTALRDE